MLINGKQQEQILIKGGEEQIGVQKRGEQKLYINRYICIADINTGDNVTISEVSSCSLNQLLDIVLFPPAAIITQNHKFLDSTDL